MDEYQDDLKDISLRLIKICSIYQDMRNEIDKFSDETGYSIIVDESGISVTGINEMEF